MNFVSGSGGAGGSNKRNTNWIFSSISDYSNQMNYITIASTGAGIDFGDLTDAKEDMMVDNHRLVYYLMEVKQNQQTHIYHILTMLLLQL